MIQIRSTFWKIFLKKINDMCRLFGTGEYRLQRMQGKGSIKLYFWVMGGQFVILVGVSLFLHWKCSENTSINDHQPEEAPATSFSSRTLFKKMFPCYLVAILRPIVLVNLAASLDLIGWSKVGPVLISYAYSSNVLIFGTIIIRNHSDLYQYIKRTWNQSKLNQSVLYVHLVCRRISGRNNSIQPSNLSGMS